MDSIGSRIRCARERADITQDQLGRLCGTTKQTIFKYENGIVTNIPMDKISLIAKILNVNPCYLMGWLDSNDCANNPSKNHFSDDEQNIIYKYRALDTRGKSAVLNVLNYEYDSLPGEKANPVAKEA